MHKRVASVVLATLALLVVLIPTPPALGTGCSHDPRADNMNWQDHYWVGWGNSLTCDLSGAFTVAVQRMNVGLLGQGARSAIDGHYGTLTHLDVEDVQDMWGTLVDGLVGSTTWSGYDNSIYSHRINANGTEFYRSTIYAPTYDLFKRYHLEIIPCSRTINFTGWEEFSIWLGVPC
jgi:hypothetical protein